MTKVEKSLYGKSKMLRFLAGSDEPIYPIGYVRHKNAFSQKNGLCQYTAEGRKGLHDNLKIDIPLMHSLMRQPLHDKSSEYADNRISLFSAQWSKCAVTGKSFQVTEDIHCHHKVPVKDGGTDQYGNLILVLEPVHKLIHATQHDTIDKYLAVLNLDRQQLHKLNELRKLVGNKTL